MENQQKDTVGLQPTEPNTLYQKPTNRDVYKRQRRSYLKEHRPVLYASLLTSGTLHRHLAEIDQACNERCV